MFGIHPVLLDSLPSGDAGVDAGASGGNDGSAPAEPQSGGQTKTAEKTAAKTAAKTALSDAIADPDPHAWMPAKHRVMKDDGSLDVEASARKNAEAYGALEKRLGSSDVPPPSAGEYKINAPDSLKDVFEPDDPGFKEFLTDAYAAGMTQKQMDASMSGFFRIVPKMLQANQEMDQEACEAVLADVWKDQTERTGNYKAASRAIRVFGGERAERLENRYGNDPEIIWYFAQVGRELREDTSPRSSGPIASDVQSLMANPAFSDPRHPDHERVSAQWREALNKTK